MPISGRTVWSSDGQLSPSFKVKHSLYKLLQDIDSLPGELMKPYAYKEKTDL
jgi:hypothetical protein